MFKQILNVGQFALVGQTRFYSDVIGAILLYWNVGDSDSYCASGNWGYNKQRHGFSIYFVASTYS